MRSTADYLQIPVDLGDRGYPVLIGSRILTELGTLLRRRHVLGKIAVVSTPPVLDLYGAQIEEALEDWESDVHILSIADGEEAKTLETVALLYDQFLKREFERSSTIVALGGGMVGDTAGFAAATLFRGINFVQVPTTILAQVDAAIGGKVGVNHPLGKNLVGAIYQPRFVLADISTLQTLPEREVRSGLAEVIKYGIIRDRDLFAFIEEHLDELIAGDEDALTRAVADCCRIKAEIVQEDEREITGLRAILNYGHTLGHAVESLSGYGRFRHGEAVAIGMLAAGELAREHTGFPEEERDRFTRLILQAGFSTDLSGLEDDAIIARTRTDKKVRNGKVRYVLPERIGEVRLVSGISDDSVRRALDYVRALS
ncbi:MAG: 3-dehydroquinate synthase [bacterium]